MSEEEGERGGGERAGGGKRGGRDGERRGRGKCQGCLGIAWVCGGSIRNKMSAFGFRHIEFENMVSFTIQCGYDVQQSFRNTALEVTSGLIMRTEAMRLNEISEVKIM